MRTQNTSSAHLRRERRSAVARRDRRSAIVAAGLAFGIIATAGVATAPAASAQGAARSSMTSIVLASFNSAESPIAATSAGEPDEASGEARDALAAAEATRAAALVLAADIEGSGLDLGVPDTSVDTVDLEVAVERLTTANDVATPFVPFLTDEVAAEVATVEGQVTALRGALDEAKARKAAEEAAEKARLEAEAAAKAAAEAAAAEAAAEAAAATSAPARPAGSSRPAASAPLPVPTGGGDNSPAAAQAAARSMGASNYGWGEDQMSCLVPLWNKESGWNYLAHNRSSGAHGIPQALPGGKMASAGADWQTNAATQVAWGLGYIAGRYGTPCGAWSHSQSVGWY